MGVQEDMGITKPPEQMAGMYANSLTRESERFVRSDVEYAFFVGYQAAKDQLADADKVMNSLNNSNGWISIKDRLPEDISDVLILSKEKQSCVGYYRSSDNDWNMYNPCCSFHMELHGVTHWMPLPAAPKK